MLLTLAGHWIPKGFQKHQCLAPDPEVLICLGCGLGIGILKSSKGDSNMHPNLRPLRQGLQKLLLANGGKQGFR